MSRVGVAVIAVVVGALFGVDASAFTCTRTPGLGPSVFWPVRQVVIRPSGGGFEVSAGTLIEVLERGAAEWTGPDCSDLSVVVGDQTLTRVVGFDWHAGSGSPENENIVTFRNDTLGDDLDRWVHTLGALAITTVTFDTASGRLLDADIEINDVAFDFSTCDPDDANCVLAFDLENTLTHELGHVVGLDHPPNDAPGAFEATMFASATRTDTSKRDLADDDIAGLCTIYPTGVPEAGECYGVGRPGPSTISFEQVACGQGDAPVAGALAIMGLCWRRRRGRTRK